MSEYIDDDRLWEKPKLVKRIKELERQLADIKVLVDGVDWFSPESLAETLRWIETTQRRTDDET
jgi:hypothetical protein